MTVARTEPEWADIKSCILVVDASRLMLRFSTTCISHRSQQMSCFDLPHLWLQTFLFAVALSVSAGADSVADETFTVPGSVTKVLAGRCVDCHSGDEPEGDVRLDTFNQLELTERLALLNQAQEQLFFGLMPPAEAEQPTNAERTLLADWLSQELRRHKASTLEQKLQRPEFGNYLDHEKLFSGEYKHLPGCTYDRRWLISEFIFNDKFNRMLRGQTTWNYGSKRVSVFGGKSFHQLTPTNPFLLPNRSGIRYYANTDLTGGHLSTMLTNAQKTAELITGYLVPRYKKSRDQYLPAVVEIMALEDQHNETLAASREFLETNIARVCEDLYGDENDSLLPEFVPVVLNEIKELKEGETYKKAPVHVAQNTLAKLGGEDATYQILLQPELRELSNDEIRNRCERQWFYNGDHERTIQGRVTILRDYLPEFRERLETSGTKIKLRVYKPLADEEMATIHAAITKHRQKGDFYTAVIEKCMSQWETDFRQVRIEAGPPSDELLARLVDQLFLQVLERSPDKEEAADHLALAKSYQSKTGNLKAIQKLIQTLMLSSEFAYRQEFGSGEADKHGRRMLSPRDASYAIAYALTDQSPDDELAEAAANGRLNTREDYEREITRMLARRDLYYLIDPNLTDRNYRDNVTNAPIRKLRFIREFFGYPKALTIFKDEKRFGGDRLGNATNRLINEADRLLEYILEKDEHVFEELLTTEKFYVYHDGDNERMQAASDRIKRIYDHFKDTDWQNFKKEDLLDHRDFLKEVKMRSVDPDKLDARNRQGNTIQLFKKSMATITARLDKGQREAAPFDLYRGYGNDFMTGYNVAKFFNLSLDNWDYATVQPAKVANRRGLLTHPAWLIAHAQNTETDPVIRGKWIREKLLAGTVPDVPITVDAVIPEDHDSTLRNRLASATETDYCWKCHRHMNPLGYALEQYDDFGRYREEESLEYPDKLIKEGPEQRGNHLVDTRDVFEAVPVDSTGHLLGTGDESLDGDIDGAMELAERLAKSRRVRQSIIRHAFRYFMGRNERLSDSKTLIDAEQEYIGSHGSFDAVIVSLLTSDSFIYRKAIEN